ncbi:DUF4910 domain-containing protein [Candidatus Omnitrophota bacterium]
MKAGMLKIVNDLWLKRRDLVSDGFDESLAYISRKIPLKIHRVPSGTKCWTWVVPKKWTVQAAHIEDLSGRRLLDLEQHPLHVISYSEPVDKVVTKTELMKHLHTNTRRPKAIPFEFSYYEKKWGFCIQHNRLKEFNKNKYRVFIDSKFEKGKLKVGEITVKGRSRKVVVLVAHLCHPAMVNDDLSGVAVLLDIAQELQKRKNYYTYKFLLVPETIGSIAYLSRNEDIAAKIKYGIFLEMLGNDNTHALQLTKPANTRIDRIARYVMQRVLKSFRQGAFLEVIGNDEKVFNAPGVDIPMISISRYPYPEYHTSDDNPGIISPRNLRESKNLILRILNIIDRDYIPRRKFKGPLYLSGYGLWVDRKKDLQLNKSLRKIMLHLDQGASAFEIANNLNIDFETVINFLEKLYQKELIEKESADHE